jgi:hypothetical protein
MRARNQCQEPLVLCAGDRRAWIEATCCSPRGEILTAKCRGTNAGTADGEPCKSCNYTAWDRELDLGENIEMIGEREIMVNVLLLPEMSRAERAGRAKKMKCSHCPALRRRRRCKAAPPLQGGAIGRSSIVATLQRKSLVYCAFQLISCQPRLGTRPGGLGETQTVTVKDS